jgi:hypothetical protein
VKGIIFHTNASKVGGSFILWLDADVLEEIDVDCRAQKRDEIVLYFY